MHKLIGTSTEDLALEKADGRIRAAHKFKLKHQSPTTTEHRLPITMAEADSLSEFKSQLVHRADLSVPHTPFPSILPWRSANYSSRPRPRAVIGNF